MGDGPTNLVDKKTPNRDTARKSSDGTPREALKQQSRRETGKTNRNLLRLSVQHRGNFCYSHVVLLEFDVCLVDTVGTWPDQWKNQVYMLVITKKMELATWYVALSQLVWFFTCSAGHQWSRTRQVWDREKATIVLEWPCQKVFVISIFCHFRNLIPEKQKQSEPTQHTCYKQSPPPHPPNPELTNTHRNTRSSLLPT